MIRSVNAQDRIDTYEKFEVITDPDTYTFTLKSAEFDNVFLRLDGFAVKPGKYYENGGGKVNAQVCGILPSAISVLQK